MSRAEAAMAQEAARAKKGRANLLPYLILILLLELALTAHFLRRDPLIARRLASWHKAHYEAKRQEQLRAMMRKDPAVGTKAPLIMGTAVNGKWQTATATKPTVVIFVGACTSCLAKELKIWERAMSERQGEVRVLIVSRDSKENIRKFLRETRLSLPIIPDPQGSLSKTYNVVWVPRAYGLDGEGKLIWVQTDERLSPARLVEEFMQRQGGAAGEHTDQNRRIHAH